MKHASTKRRESPRGRKGGRRGSDEERTLVCEYIYGLCIRAARCSEARLALARRDLQLDFWFSRTGRDAGRVATLLFFECRIGPRDERKKERKRERKRDAPDASH